MFIRVSYFYINNKYILLLLHFGVTFQDPSVLVKNNGVIFADFSFYLAPFSRN